MRVLVLSQYFWPESFRINEVSQSLRDAGCDVTVLTGQPNYPEGRPFKGYRAFAAGCEEYSGMTVYRVPLVPRGDARALRLIANYVSFVIGAGLLGPWLLRGQRFDVILVYGISPILQVLPGIVLRRFTGAALVPWVQDLWPQSLEVTGFVRRPWVLSMVGTLVRWIYRKSDLLLVQSRSFVPSVAAMANGTPVEYHPNPGELAFGQTRQKKAVLTLDLGFNVVFAGNMGSVQALDTVLDAAELLRDQRAIRFVLIGSGSRAEWVAQEIRRRGLPNVQMPGRFAPEDMPQIYSQAAALLVTLAKNPIMSQTIPSKVQAYLAAGRPIIASIDGEGARIIEDAGAGVTCPAEDPHALAAAVMTLARGRNENLHQMGARGRNYYENHFEPGALALRLKNRLTQLVATRAGVDLHHV